MNSQKSLQIIIESPPQNRCSAGLTCLKRHNPLFPFLSLENLTKRWRRNMSSRFFLNPILFPFHLPKLIFSKVSSCLSLFPILWWHRKQKTLNYLQYLYVTRWCFILEHWLYSISYFCFINPNRVMKFPIFILCDWFWVSCFVSTVLVLARMGSFGFWWSCSESKMFWWKIQAR